MQDRYDRYTIKDTIEGLRIEMNQSRNALRLIAICLTAAIAAYYFGPYGDNIFLESTPFWAVEAFMGIMVFLSVVGYFYTESVLISGESISIKSFSGKVRVVPRDNVKRIMLTCHSSADSASEWQIDLVDASDKGVGVAFNFIREKDAKCMLKAIQMRTNIPVSETKG